VIDRVTHLGMKPDGPLQRSRSCSYIGAFYKTSNSDYSAKWECIDDAQKEATSGGTRLDRARIPKLGEVMNNKDLIRRPVRTMVDTGRFVLTKEKDDFLASRRSDPVISAHVVPMLFPVEAKDIVYPETEKAGIDNPLYQTAAQSIGKEVPMPHQLPERFFPRSTKFSSGYTDLRPRYSSINTRPEYSRTHQDNDVFR